jgi:hypothetical protein
VALIVPSMMPSRQISGLFQSGHQRRRAADASPLADTGASASTRAAITATGTLQTTKPHCQLPPTSGSTSGSINATGRISPISRPLV